MYILGIDASTRVAGAAVMNADRLVSERFVHNQLNHSEIILPMIKQVLEDADITPQQLTCIGVAGGPGSFTGLRIGMSIAKTMGMALDIPVIPISTLDALAWNLHRHQGLVCPILDAKKQEVYTCIYRFRDDELEPLSKPMAVKPEQLLKDLVERNESVTFVGDGVPVFREQVIEILGDKAFFGTMVNSYPRAASFAELALIKFMTGETSEDLLMEPVYLRKSEAEVTWEARNKGSLKSSEKI